MTFSHQDLYLLKIGAGCQRNFFAMTPSNQHIPVHPALLVDLPVQAGSFDLLASHILTLMSRFLPPTEYPPFRSIDSLNVPLAPNASAFLPFLLAWMGLRSLPFAPNFAPWRWGCYFSLFPPQTPISCTADPILCLQRELLEWDRSRIYPDIRQVPSVSFLKHCLLSASPPVLPYLLTFSEFFRGAAISRHARIFLLNRCRICSFFFFDAGA